ncbi:MAG TPA: NUDIX domain-containing protein [Burkholderiales bacterium]|nr:NUDIX domain-containing protein [Burkholderiales bacterium]
MTSAIAQPAATVTLVRDTPRGLEVLLLQRSLRSGFMPGVYVFPGGALEEADSAPGIGALCAGLDEAAASRTLGIGRGGLAYWIAAIREAFEEAGILLACDARGELVSFAQEPLARRFHEYRKCVEAGDLTLEAVLVAEKLRLAADRLVYFAHWITPVGLPRRYDTRFFAAVAPERQEAAHDESETIAHAWVRPAEALARYRSGEYRLRAPTLATLERFAAFDSSAALIAALRAQRDIPEILPRIARDGRSLLPGDPEYEQAADFGFGTEGGMQSGEKREARDKG